jgi:hypothetical protein
MGVIAPGSTLNPYLMREATAETLVRLIGSPKELLVCFVSNEKRLRDHTFS